MTNNVLIFITSPTCPHCTKFKESILPELKKKLEIIELNYRDYNQDKFPKNISGYFKWFPMLISIPVSSFKLRKMDGYSIFNGTKTFPPQLEKTYAMTSSKIMEWFNSTFVLSASTAASSSKYSVKKKFDSDSD